jgi:hypothetical protein
MAIPTNGTSTKLQALRFGDFEAPLADAGVLSSTTRSCACMATPDAIVERLCAELDAAAARKVRRAV